jgi:uncharacterized protein YndB with AHSA1/START domain
MTKTGTLNVMTPSDREVGTSRVFDAPRQLVFDAFTKPQLIQRWLLGPPGWTMPVCEVDLKVGGSYRYLWRGDDGKQMGVRGVFREIVPLERLVHTQLFDEDWTGGETLVTIVFSEDGGNTTVTTTVLYASREAQDGALATGMTRGMGASYDRLADILASEGSRS